MAEPRREFNNNPDGILWRLSFPQAIITNDGWGLAPPRRGREPQKEQTMAHNLARVGGEVAFFSAGREPVWHGLGQRLPGLATAAEALEAAHLNWKVELAPLSYEAIDASGMRQVAIPKKRAVLGPAKQDGSRPVFGIVGDKWSPLQNDELFSFAEAVRGEGAGRAVFETAGALGNGSRVFCLLSMEGVIEPVPGDAVKKYLLLALGHDGLMGMYGTITPVRVVCQNTLNMALGGLQAAKERGGRIQGGVWFNHFGDLKGRVEEARNLLGLAAQAFEVFEKRAALLAAKVLDVADEDAFLRKVLPINNPEDEQKILAQRAEVRRLAHEGMGNDHAGVRGTAWGMLNGFTEWTDYHRSGFGPKADTSRRVESAWLGDGSRMKARAFDELVVASMVTT